MNRQRHIIELTHAIAAVVASAAVIAWLGNALSAEIPRLLFPAGRSTYAAGEKLAVWVHIPGEKAPRPPGGRAELSLSTPAGTIITLAEDIVPEPAAVTLTYSVDSGQLAPGRYALGFTYRDAACEALFTVVDSVPEGEFAIAAAAAPAGELDAARWRELHFNHALIADPASLNADALASARARWLKELVVKTSASPADPLMVAAGTAAVQQAAQADFAAAGLVGLAITVLPPLPPPGTRGGPAMAAFARQGGAALPADPVAGFDQWCRFFGFREKLWPEALRAWSDAAHAAAPPLAFGAPAADVRGQPQPGADFAIIRGTDGSNASLELLTDAAFARSRISSRNIWAMLPPHGSGMTSAFWAALAAGAKGVIYPREAVAGTERDGLTRIAALNRTLLLHGDLLLSLEPATCSVAVLHSQTSGLHNTARAMAGQKTASHSGRVASAWAACVLACCSADIIGEASIRDGVLRRYKAVVAPDLPWVPSDVADALRAFTDDGGLLIIGADGPELAGRATRLPFTFADAVGVPPPPVIDAMRAALGNLPHSAAACSRRDWIVTHFTSGGDGRFFHVLRLSGGTEPESAGVSVPPKGVTYDVFAGREASVAAGDAGSRGMQVKLAPGQAKLFAVLPARIASVVLQAPVMRERQLLVAASLTDDAGRALKASVSAEIAVTQESGLERYRIYRQFRRGKLDLTLPMATNERPGRWQVRVTELLSGRSQAAAFTVPVQEVGGVIRAGDRVDIVRRDECRNLLKKAKSITIAVGDPAGGAAAQDLARRLGRFGIRCGVTKDKSLARGSSFVFDGDAIIIGTPAASALVKHFQGLGLLPIRIGTEFIGSGRALVFFVRSPVSAPGRGIVLCAADAAGYSRGAELLAMMCADQEPEPSRFPAVSVGAAAPPEADEPVEELLPAFTLDVGEPVTAVACDRGGLLAGGRVILAGTASGRLHAVTSEGVTAWRQRIGEPVRGIFLPGGEPSPVVIGDSSVSVFSVTSARRAFIPISGKRGGAVISRAAVSPDGSRILLATPGGLRAFDASGREVWKRVVSRAIGALAVGRDWAAFADEKNAACVNEKGDSVFTTPFADCSVLAFSLDASSPPPGPSPSVGRGASLFAGGRSGAVRRFAVPAGKMLWERKFDAPVAAIVVLAGNRTAAVFENGQVVDLAEPAAPAAPGPAATGQESQSISLGHPVRVVAEAPDHLCFAAASADGRLSVVSCDWRVRRFAFRQSSALPVVPVSSVAIAAGGRTIVIGDSAGAVHACRFR